MSENTNPKYRNPFPTVDIIIEIDSKIVLIERRNTPLGWALPGGFVDEGESLEQAAIREAKEETGLDVELTDLLYVYSNPYRDPRHHTMSTVFIANATGAPCAGDDAKNAGLFSSKDMPPLAFDHAEIIADYYSWRDHGLRPKPRTMLQRLTKR